MLEQKFHGVIISPLTPFTENGQVDLDKLQNMIEFQIGTGIGGFLVLATAGQGPLLSVEERKQIAEVIVKTNNGRLPVMVQVGTLSTADTVALAKHACSLGVDAIASLPPLYSRLDMIAIEQHLNAVAKAIGDLPLFLYNNPWAQGRALTTQEILDLNEKGILKGVVDSSRDLGSVYEFMNYQDKLTCIIADTKLSMPGLLFGCPALGSAIGNAIPELFVAMYKAVKAGDIVKAKDIEMEVFRISKVLRNPETGAIHEALKARGIDAGIPRMPIRVPTEKEKEAIHAVMKTTGI